jgi:hypothetical protein
MRDVKKLVRFCPTDESFTTQLGDFNTRRNPKSALRNESALDGLKAQSKSI